MSEPRYVVVVVGYEGIDRIVWAGCDREEAARRVIAEREAIDDAPDRGDEDDEEWLDLSPEETVRVYEDSDRVCVMAPDETGHYRCVCQALNVSVGKMILY